MPVLLMMPGGNIRNLTFPKPPPKLPFSGVLHFSTRAVLHVSRLSSGLATKMTSLALPRPGHLKSVSCTSGTMLELKVFQRAILGALQCGNKPY